MLKQSNNKFKKLFKGAVFSVACVLSLTALPVSALATNMLAGALVSDQATLSSATFGSISLDGAPNKAEKGVPYTVKDATFTKSDKSTVDVKKNGTSDALKTDITVRYKNTNVTFDLDESNQFTPTMVGTYVITYSVVDTNNKNAEYTYDYEVTCDVGEATFEFTDNDENVLPSVYDPKVFEAEGKEVKDLKLPMPKLLTVDGTENETVGFFTEAPADKNEYVLVSVKGGSQENADTILKAALTVEGKTATLSKDFVEAGEGEYTVMYQYFQKPKNGNAHLVSITTKKFEYKNNYYKVSSARNAKGGYDLVASWATNPETAAKTGVAVNLPTVRATTSTTNNPSEESVNVFFKVKVLRYNGNDYTEDVSSYVDTEKNTFTPPEAGDYKFVYEVTDFYGHTPTKSRTFYINGVKDDQKPTVYVYNAKDFKSLEKDEKGNATYNSALADFKSETRNRNMVIYAFGVNDNTIDKGATLTREIRDIGGYTRFRVTDKVLAKGEESDKVYYNDYNLILAYDKDNFKNDNFAVAQEMGETDQEQYLKDNRYLIVTQTGYVPGKETEKETFDFSKLDEQYRNVVADPESEDFDEEMFKKALLELGYAYIPYVDERPYTFGDNDYYLYYIAEDSFGNKFDQDPIKFVVSTSEYNDNTVPEVKFPTSLRTSYLPSETITFSAIKPSDNADEKVREHVMYRFLKTDKTTEIVVPELSKPDSFTVNNNSAKALEAAGASSNWYAKEEEHKTQGFIPLEEEDGQYKIDIQSALSKITSPDDKVGYLEIFVYCVDDYGNIGFYRKVITVAETGDSKPITLNSVTDSSKNSTSFIQGGTVYLPTLVYNDDLVGYMTHTVDVYHVSTAEDGTVSYRKMPSQNSNSTAQANIETYTLDAGSFTASYSGTYRVVVTVRDSGNNSVATFFNYEVTPNQVVKNPVVNNLSAETIKLDVDEIYDLPAPTLTLDESGSVAYTGYELEDDSKTSTYYTTNVVSASNNYYRKEANSFVGRVSGTYEIQYSVFVIQYKKTALGDSLKLVNGDLVLVDNGENYRVLPNYVTGKLAIYNSKNEDKTTEMTSKLTATNADVKLVPLETTNVQRINVVDSTAPTLYSIDSSAYVNQPKANGQKILIQRIEADDNSSLGIDTSKSQVLIQVERANGSRDDYPITMDEWDDATRTSGDVRYESNELYLYMLDDAKYTIQYTVYDFSNLTTESEKFTFTSGDVNKPEIVRFENGFLNKDKESYKLDDTVIIDATKITFDDNTLREAAEEDKQALIDEMIEKLSVTVTTEAGSVDVERSTDGKTYTFQLKTAGTYTISVKTYDKVGNESIAKTEKIVIASRDNSTSTSVYQTVGTILIVVSVVILLGVIAYFILSKVKLDKELKGSKKKKNKK